MLICVNLDCPIIKFSHDLETEELRVRTTISSN